ncbi:YdiU family protein [Rhodosalinus halophilus]|uniref:Protein nucleotidyltransferase YdiU n=1 Tax=Rhodosalinus halophilus TaxID=2259333 RepID=A0A365U4I3_9RHOB|nr:YdiU family protein [Rhodosalinus halophilus]RBI82923.1 YdiU family protein [Rhodosalinus halophilus]
MTLAIPFDNSYATLPGALFTRIDPTPVKAPQLLAFNHALARELGITPGAEDELARVFAGNEVPEGAAPIAQRYAGHQFGQFNPQLGDGRAHLLGEVIDRHGRRRDIQLKGSGRTPYSRMGDGRAWLGPVLREYVVSEAMHALGVPTTRALAAVATGEPVVREAVLPGAVLTRVAASHIRVGTFQIFAALQDIASLKALYEHTIERHYPQADGPQALLDAVIAAQARLVAQWMSVGFIHGVMNTDNCAISGETIDYGPCAFVDDYHPETVFSSIDRMGRYAYANQPDIAVWNMAQFATALVPLMPDRDKAVEAFTASVHAMPALLRAEWRARFRAKLGLETEQDGDGALISELLDIMAAQGADFTNTFRGLAEGTARREFSDPAAFDAWEAKWRARLEAESGDPEARMLAANPAVIPRNHRIEHMIEAAVGGDMGPFHTLMETLATPYETPESPLLVTPPRPEERVAATFCGT